MCESWQTTLYSDCLDLFLNVLWAFLSWVLPDFTIRFWCSSLWMSLRFVACVTRYSRGAENRCGGKYNTSFIAIFLRCITAKNYPNWPRIGKVIAEIKRVQFFWNTVYLSSISETCRDLCRHCKCWQAVCFWSFFHPSLLRFTSHLGLGRLNELQPIGNDSLWLGSER